MRRAIIFNGAWALASCGLLVFFRGRQVRRERDEQSRDDQVLQRTTTAATAMTMALSIADLEGPELNFDSNLWRNTR